MKRVFYQTAGWFFVVLGVIGVVLPILPTMPFLIMASACFAKSSERFHQMLLNNPWFGVELSRWESQKTVSRQTKRKATWTIVLTFALSIGLLMGKVALQLMLVVIASLLLWSLWRLNE